MCVVDVGDVGRKFCFVLWFRSLTNRFHGSFYLMIFVTILLEYGGEEIQFPWEGILIT